MVAPGGLTRRESNDERCVPARNARVGQVAVAIVQPDVAEEVEEDGLVVIAGAVALDQCREERRQEGGQAAQALGGHIGRDLLLVDVTAIERQELPPRGNDADGGGGRLARQALLLQVSGT